MVSTGLLQRTKGFTLIEIAIVLVVIGLLLSGGLLAVAPVLERTQITETENKMDLIEDSLVLYAIQNGCLPCPAQATDNSGIQQTTAGADVATACNNAVACYENVNSVVPWQTLGLARSDAIDAWGTFISYRLSTSASSNATVPGTPACDDLQNPVLASASGFRRDGTDYPQGCLDIETEAIGTSVTFEAAYALISHGADTGGGFFSESGNARTNPHAGNTVQDENDTATCDDDVSECHQGARIDVEGANYFDDIVRWKTAPRIIQECGSGTSTTCGNP